MTRYYKPRETPPGTQMSLRHQKLTKTERKAIQSCAKSESDSSIAVFNCAMEKLDLSPNMPLDQYDRLQAAAFKAQRRANRHAIRKNYGKGTLGRSSDASMAKKSLREERKAVRDYGQRIKKAKSPALKKALRHARKEERQHAAMFAKLAKRGR